MLINGKGNVNCPGVPFLMSLFPPPLLPLLSGMNLTDKGCLPPMDLIVQTTAPHNFDLLPPGVFSGCNATNSPLATIKADPKNGWISLNLISTASLQEMVGKYLREDLFCLLLRHMIQCLLMTTQCGCTPSTAGLLSPSR